MAKTKDNNKRIEPSQNLRQLPVELEKNAGGEIVIYNPDESVRLEVRIEDDTVWLNREQLGILFNRDKKTIGNDVHKGFRHQRNHFRETLGIHYNGRCA